MTAGEPLGLWPNRYWCSCTLYHREQIGIVTATEDLELETILIRLWDTELPRPREAVLGNGRGQAV